MSNQFGQTIGVIDTASQRLVDEIQVSGDPVPIALDPLEDVLHVATNEDCLFAIDLASRRVMDALALPATSHHMVMHPQQRRLYISTRAAGVILEVGLAPYLVSRRWVVGGVPQSLAIRRDGGQMFVANEAGRVDILDLTGGRVTDRIELGHCGGFGIVLSPRESELFVSIPLSGQVRIFDTRTLKQIEIVRVGGTPREMVVEPLSRKVLVANEAGWLTVFGQVAAGNLPATGRPADR